MVLMGAGVGWGGGGRGQDRKEADPTHSLNSEPEDLCRL
jgi:hypothetical protein